MSAQEIKLCPFCGDEAFLAHGRLDDGSIAAAVKCTTRDCVTGPIRPNAEYAIKAWNHRVAEVTP